MVCFAVVGRRALLLKPGSEQEQLSQAAPGKLRDEQNTEKFLLPTPAQGWSAGL